MATFDVQSYTRSVLNLMCPTTHHFNSAPFQDLTEETLRVLALHHLRVANIPIIGIILASISS